MIFFGMQVVLVSGDKPTWRRVALAVEWGLFCCLVGSGKR